MKRNFARVFGSLAVVLALGAILGHSALAAGGPGSGPNYGTFPSQQLDLTPQGEFMLTGVLACNVLPGDVVMSSGLTQATGKILKEDPFDFSNDGKLVQGGNSAQFRCIGNPDQSSSLVVAADAQLGFPLGNVDVALGVG